MKRLFKVTYATSVGRVDFKVVEFSNLRTFGDRIRTESGKILDCKEINQ